MDVISTLLIETRFWAAWSSGLGRFISITMATALSCSRTLLVPELPPFFLAPSLFRQNVPSSCTLQFSTSTARSLRTRDMSRNRGVSALRRTGLKHPVSMSKEPLPRPVLDPARRSKVQVDPNHGLWAFFNKERKPLTKPEVEAAHGTLTSCLYENILSLRPQVGPGR